MIVLTPTHRLAREIKQRNVDACSYHSCIHWKGDEWTPDQMGEKFIPEIIIWDETCTVSLDALKRFLDWLLLSDTKVIMCGDHAQPPPFVGLSQHDWLKNFVDYYEGIDTEQLREFKKLIRLQPNTIKCEVAREIISETTMNEFWEAWIPNDLIEASRKMVRGFLFALHKEKVSTLSVPLCYRPSDTRKQNVEVEIPG